MSAAAVPATPSAPAEPGALAVLALGGTILGGLGPDGGYAPSLGLEGFLLGLGPAVPPRLVAIGGAQLPSADLRLAGIVAAVRSAQDAVLAGACGVVVMCGTDTLEEVAFTFDLLWDLEEPVVVTGALRTPDAPGADGPANFLAASVTAAAAAARGRGALVVMDDRVHAARALRKVHPSGPGAFASPGSGPVGQVVEGVVRFFARTERPAPLSWHVDDDPAPVALLTFAVGDEGRLIEEVPTLGYRGLVIEGSGGGSVSRVWAEALSRVVPRIPVVYASRTGTGPVLERTYSGGGGEVDLRRLGVHPAGVLDGLKARVLLSLVLGQDADVTSAFQPRTR